MRLIALIVTSALAGYLLGIDQRVFAIVSAVLAAVILADLLAEILGEDEDDDDHYNPGAYAC